MKKSLFSLSLVALALSSATTCAQEYPSRYMDGSAKLVTAPNGAVINAEVLQVMPQNVYTEKTVEKVTDGWTFYCKFDRY